MLTGGKLAGGIVFALLFWLVSTMAYPIFAEQQKAPLLWFFQINCVLAFILGWRIAGASAGKGTWSGAISYGLTTGVAITVTILFAHSFVRMVELSMRKQYDGPVEAIVGVFVLMFELGPLLATVPVLVTIGLGSMLAGLLTERAGRAWS